MSPLNTGSPPWYREPENIADLLRWLRGRGDIDTLDEAIRVTEEAWHWSDGYAAMLAERAADNADAQRTAAILEERGLR